MVLFTERNLHYTYPLASYVCACVRVCVCVYVCACLLACACVHACLCVCVQDSVCTRTSTTGKPKFGMMTATPSVPARMATPDFTDARRGR